MSEEPLSAALCGYLRAFDMYLKARTRAGVSGEMAVIAREAMSARLDDAFFGRSLVPPSLRPDRQGAHHNVSATMRCRK